MRRPISNEWHAAAAVTVLVCVSCMALTLAADEGKVSHRRLLQQNDAGLPSPVNFQGILGKGLIDMADNLKTFFSGNQQAQVQTTDATSATTPTSDRSTFLSRLYRPGAPNKTTAYPPAQAPRPAEAPAVVGALLKGAPVAAPIKNTHHAAHAPAASEGIIVIGTHGPYLHAPAPGPSIDISINVPSVDEILRRLNHTRPQTHPLKVARPPTAPHHTPNATAKTQAFRQTALPRKSVFKAANVKAMFALAPEASAAAEPLPAKFPESLGLAPAPAASLQRRLLEGSDSSNPFDLAQQAAAVRSDFEKFEAKQLQQQGAAGSSPGRSEQVVPPARGDPSVKFPGTVLPTAPLPGPPAAIGQRGNPAAVFSAPIVAPAMAPGSDVENPAAPFPGITKGSPGFAMAPAPKVYLD